MRVIHTGNGSRPASPMPLENDARSMRGPRYATSSPREKAAREQSSSYFTSSTSNKDMSNGRPVRTPAETPRALQFKPSHGLNTDHPIRLVTSGHNSGLLPPNSPYVKVIHENGQADICDVEGIRNADEMALRILRQTRLSDRQPRNYHFYVLEGLEANYAHCRRLSDAELFAIGLDLARPERQRLILRKAVLGEPEGVQLVTAAKVAEEQVRATASPSNVLYEKRSRAKLEKLTGESLPPLSYPMSPSTIKRRKEEEMHSQSVDFDNDETPLALPPRPRPRKVDSFAGDRPESQFVVADPATYFPDVRKDEIEKSVRMAQRRSQRVSRANSRLSTTSRLSIASNFSNSSMPSDVPAVPAIPDGFANGQMTPIRARPLSILRLGHPHSTFRDSIASSNLEPLDEESSYEPNRRSYVSFGGESQPGSATVSISERDSHGHSYFDGDNDNDGSSSPPTENGGSVNDIKEALAEDGEDADPELNDFLTDVSNDAWDNIKCIRGKLIGQGSFGSVYMALHSFTAELMAVKQVDLPSTATSVTDARKNNMIEALKREIALLRELKHPNIVSYIGSNSDEHNLNIFLEYVPGGSIAKMLVDYGAMQEEMVIRLVRQILVGLAYLHSKDIIHRDIKGANILVDTHGTVKISDFGISKRVQDSKTLLSEESGGSGTKTGGRAGLANHRVSLQGSVFWMAPEVVKQTAYTRKADIWSLGCLVVEMLTGSHPHPNLSQIQAIFKIGGRGTQTDPSPDLPTKASKEARDFLKSTFRVDYEARPEAEELLRMPLMKQGSR